jgi:hypothetical protein
MPEARSPSPASGDTGGCRKRGGHRRFPLGGEEDRGAAIEHVGPRRCAACDEAGAPFAAVPRRRRGRARCDRQRGTAAVGGAIPVAAIGESEMTSPYGPRSHRVAWSSGREPEKSPAGERRQTRGPGGAVPRDDDVFAGINMPASAGKTSHGASHFDARQGQAVGAGVLSSTYSKSSGVPGVRGADPDGT